jgi:hypothetical protein
MTASLIPISTGSPMIFTQSEATAAQRTWPFYLSNTADGSPATGKTIAGSDFRISKAGGAFGNAVGAVTELSLGWYKMVFDVGDLDTVGALACELSVEAGVDPLRVTHQVTVLDLNVATVNPGAAGITSSSFAAGAITAAAIAADAIGASELAADAVAEVQAGLATGANVLDSRQVRSVVYVMGELTADGSTAPISMADVVSAEIALAGTWDGSTVTVQRCDDVLADPQVWTTYASGAQTADAVVSITGPVAGIRATMSNDGAASDVVVTATMVK